MPYQAFECADGLMYMVGAGNDKQVRSAKQSFINLFQSRRWDDRSTGPQLIMHLLCTVVYCPRSLRSSRKPWACRS